MPISFHEKPKSRESSENPRSITFHYTLAGTQDDAVARAYAIAATVAIYDSLFRQDVRLDAVGFNLWDVTVPYGPTKSPEPGDFKWQFDTTGATAHVTYTKHNIMQRAAPGFVPKDHKGAIGVTEDGEVEGCEVVIPQLKWTETHQLNAAAVTFAYGQTLKAVTGRVNDAAFRSFGAKTVRFDGASGGGSNKDPDIVELTFHFTQSDNVILRIGDIDPFTKGGWEYLWIEYKVVDDPVAKEPKVVARQANLERVYDEADFSLLGIGTTAP